MRVGIPAEVKNNERRVAITPEGVDALVRSGHEVAVQTGAGLGAGITDDDFRGAGASIAPTADAVWSSNELIVKVKEPIADEFVRLQRGQVLFTYLHLAASEPCTRALLDAGVTSIAYETVRLADGSLPLLAPMSEVAGRLSITVGAHHLLGPFGGRGVVLGGVPGTPKAKVVVIGGGVAGEHAARSAIGLGADVTIVDISTARLRHLEAVLGERVQTRLSTPREIAALVADADLVIGSVLVPGAAAPKLVTDEMVARMREGSVLVDIAIDQGGCFEGSRATTHDAPTFRVHDAIYYCVANMPGAVPHTATRALTNATLPYVRRLADRGWIDALTSDSSLAAGLHTVDGVLTNAEVARALHLDWRPVADMLDASM
ncbi:alanine dehydrogenase [Microcella sp.]|uniref:alanine dehydrogenase n=1 Tax=Microcella sp. TaxID=1913979 RepID=UPI003F6F5562